MSDEGNPPGQERPTSGEEPAPPEPAPDDEDKDE